MVTIDLTTPPPPPLGFLEGLPRRLALTMPELRQAARLAGDAPLPFDVSDPPEPTGDGLQGRLGHTSARTDDRAYATALTSLRDGEETLRRRGLLGDDGIDPRLSGAIGLLATPELALDIDVSAGGTQVKAWHRQAGNAVATLSTCDGVVFELAWFATDQWPAELARVASIPDDVRLGASTLPEEIDLPFQLVDAVGEAVRSGRSDLVPVLMERHGGEVTGTDGRPLTSGETSTAIAGIHTEGQGRLRVLAARVAQEATESIGLVSWVLLADGWHSLVPHQLEDESRIVIRRTTPDALAVELAPVLAQVSA